MLPSPSGSSSMSDVRVSVVLTPLSLGHDLTRTFILSDDNPEFEIGRSSKRDVRNRSPASDNGWFDSGVMSRKHAMFSICPQKKNIYICDSGSTHGTWLNNVRLLEYEPTPLISGDVLRFGITVERGHDVVAPLTVACKIDWLNNTDYEPGVPENISSVHVAELKTSVNPKPLSSLRPSSTNTFCVPDDSEVEELPNPNISLPDEAVEAFHAGALQASQEAFSRVAEEHDQENNPPKDTSQTSQAQQRDCIIIEQPEEQMGEYSDDDSDEDSDDFLGSDEEESDLEPSALPSSHSSSFNYADNGIEAKLHREEMSVEPSDDESDFSGSDPEFESDDESAASSHEKPVDNDHIEFINPDVLMQNNTSDATSFDQPPKAVPENSVSSTAPVTTVAPKLNSEKPHRPHPDSVITAEELPQSLHTLESNQHSVYQDGRFSCVNTTAPEETTAEGPVVRLPAWSLKRKLSEMETQDAQIVDSALPATQAELDRLPNPEVVDAISSALSESEPPKKRVKSSHSPSGTVASYTATAVISALLGGLGTIALLAALPAEYFQ